MPKLPRSAAGTRSGTKARSRNTRAKPPAGKASAGKAKGDGGYERRPVDAADGNGAVATSIELNEFERGLLGDLFAVVEEHAGEAADQIDRSQIEHAFVF